MGSKHDNVVPLPNGTDQAGASHLTALPSLLAKHPEIRNIRLCIVDYSGVLRTRLVTASRALQIAAQPDGHLATDVPIMYIGMQSGAFLFDAVESGQYDWKPDWSSLRQLTVFPESAVVMCRVEERPIKTSDKELSEDEVLSTCPRSVLSRVVEKAKEKHDVEFLVGFEIEFALLQSKTSTEALDTPQSGWAMASTRTKSWRTVADEVVNLLEDAGVGVWTYNAEGGPATYEISLSPLPPLAAVDAVMFAQETIRSVAEKQGYHATMHAKPFEKGPCVGQHMHLSLSSPEMGSSFLAGFLKHMPGLSALMLANMDSYQRNKFYGAGPAMWGWRNKLVPAKRMQEAYYELRPPDAFANVYLMLAAIIGAGMQAVEDKEELTMKSIEEVCINGAPTEEQRKKYNIPLQDLPSSLGDALAELEKDAVIKEALGATCSDRYLTLKKKDLEACKKMTMTERRLALVQLF